FRRRQPLRGVAVGGGTHRGEDSPLSVRDLNGRAPTAPPPGRRRGWRAGRRGGSLPSLVDRGSHVRALAPVRHEGRDGAALATGEREVREERVALEGLDDRRDPVVATDAEVVALCHVVGEDDLRVLPDA